MMLVLRGTVTIVRAVVVAVVVVAVASIAVTVVVAAVVVMIWQPWYDGNGDSSGSRGISVLAP